MRGTPEGPSQPGASCPSSDWVWSHGDCAVPPAPQQLHAAYTNDSADVVLRWASTANATSAAFFRPAAASPAAPWTRANATHDGFTAADANPSGVQNLYTARLSGLSPG